MIVEVHYQRPVPSSRMSRNYGSPINEISGKRSFDFLYFSKLFFYNLNPPVAMKPEIDNVFPRISLPRAFLFQSFVRGAFLRGRPFCFSAFSIVTLPKLLRF